MESKEVEDKLKKLTKIHKILDDNVTGAVIGYTIPSYSNQEGYGVMIISRSNTTIGSGFLINDAFCKAFSYTETLVEARIDKNVNENKEMSSLLGTQSKGAIRNPISI